MRALNMARRLIPFLKCMRQIEWIVGLGINKRK